MKLLTGLMNLWRFLFDKSPKAINEMKPVDIGEFFNNSNVVLNGFIYQSYWKVKKSWKRSPKNYSFFYNIDSPFNYKIVKNSSICSSAFQSKNNVVIGNLYELYQQYYGKENKSKS